MFSTVFYTVLSGILVYVLGQIFSKFFIDPIQDQRMVIGKISDALIFYANVYTNPKTKDGFDMPDERKAGMILFRNLACELISKTHLIPYYKQLSYLKIVRTGEDISNAHRKLIALSNSMYPLDSQHAIQNSKFQDELEKCLNLITH